MSPQLVKLGQDNLVIGAVGDGNLTWSNLISDLAELNIEIVVDNRAVVEAVADIVLAGTVDKLAQDVSMLGRFAHRIIVLHLGAVAQVKVRLAGPQVESAVMLGDQSGVFASQGTDSVHPLVNVEQLRVEQATIGHQIGIIVAPIIRDVRGDIEVNQYANLPLLKCKLFFAGQRNLASILAGAILALPLGCSERGKQQSTNRLHSFFFLLGVMQLLYLVIFFVTIPVERLLALFIHPPIHG